MPITIQPPPPDLNVEATEDGIAEFEALALQATGFTMDQLLAIDGWFKLYAQLRAGGVPKDQMIDLATGRARTPDNPYVRPAERNIPAGTADEVFWMADGRCLACNVRMAPRGGLDHSFEVDHILPRSRGGTDDISNYQPLCSACNRSKGTRHIDYRGRVGVH